MQKPGSSTLSIHGKTNYKKKFGSVVIPIFQSSSYLFPFEEEKLKYPRYSNLPNQDEVIDRIAQLESAEAGVLFSSGMGAISTTLLTVLKPGDHIIVQDQIYGGTYSFLQGNFKKWGIEITYKDFSTNSDFSNEIKSNTKAVYIESPSNPLLKVVNIPEIADFARKRNIISIIDNTFATPINQQPFTMGIDIIVHSATKYLNGHSDLTAGVVLGKGDIIKQIKRNARDLGCTTNDLTAFLLSRGLKTLAIRVEKQNLNAQKLAEFFENHNKIEKVYYPGLKSNPQFALANILMKGFGGMLSVEIKSDSKDIDVILGKLKYFSRAVSLGGVESLVCLPSETSHSYLAENERENLGIRNNLVRISAGIEDIADLIGDWEQALK